MACPYPFNRNTAVNFDYQELQIIYELLVDQTTLPKNQDTMMLDFFQAVIDNLLEACPDLKMSHNDDCDGSLDE